MRRVKGSAPKYEAVTASSDYQRFMMRAPRWPGLLLERGAFAVDTPRAVCARTTSSRGTVCLPSSIFAIVSAGVTRVVDFPLVDQPRLHESAEKPFPRCWRLGLQDL